MTFGTSDGTDTTASEGRDDAADSADEEDPAPRRRSSFQPIAPEPESATEPEAASTPDAVPLPEPAFAPEPASFRRPASTPEPEPGPAPKSAPLPDPEVAPPAPVSAREALPDAQPTPPLFKPRPDVDRPWVTRPRDAAVDAGMHSEEHDSSRRRDTPDAKPAQNDTADNDSAPFVWSLTPNDELDPIVHATSSEASESAPAEPVLPIIPAPVAGRATTQPEPTAPQPSDPGLANPEPTDPEPTDPEPTDPEPTDPESTEPEPIEPEPAGPRTARVDTTATGLASTQPLDDDAASLAFLMELEAAAAAMSAEEDDDAADDDGPRDNVDNHSNSDDRTRAPGPRPVAAASLSTAEFAGSSELFPVAGASGSAASGSAASGSADSDNVDSDNAATGAMPSRAKRESGSGSERPPLPPVVKWVALGVAALLVLGALFFLGTRLPGLFGASAPAATPSATATPTPTETPTPTLTAPPAEVVAAVGPVAPGEHKWDALLGGECLEPYSTPWAETFTVVDCATPHTAQMVFTAPVTSDPAAPYPGEAEIAKQLALWCSAPGVLDLAAAGAYSDLQVQGTYPVSAEQWADGERNYSCFLTRSTGEALTGTLAVAQPAT